MIKVIEIVSKISTRQLIALALTILFTVLSLTGKVESSQVSTIYGMIIGFYFGNKTALDTPDGYSLKNDKTIE